MHASQASSDFTHYSPALRPPDPTTTPRASFSIEQDDDDDPPQPSARFDLCRHFCCRHTSIMLLQVVSVFAAVNLNRLLKSLLSPHDTKHTHVLIGTLGLFSWVRFITQWLVHRLRHVPRAVWIVGLVGGHIMGFSTKQYYVATVQIVTVNVKHHTQTIFLAVIWGLLPMLAVISGGLVAEPRSKTCCCKSKSKTNTTGGGSRHRAVMREALNDASAIALGFGIYAAWSGTVKYDSPRALKELFEEEESCYAPEEANRTRRLLGGDGTGDSPEQHLWFIVSFFLMMVSFPVLSYLFRRQGRQRKVKYYTTSQERRKNLWLTQANWFDMFSTSLAFALGFALHEIVTYLWSDFRDNSDHMKFRENSAHMLVLIMFSAIFLWALSTSTQTCSSVRRTLRERWESQRTGEPVHRSLWVKYRVEMLVPTVTLMLVVVVGLLFEAFFDCAQAQIVEAIHVQHTVGVLATFTVVGVLALVLVSWGLGRAYSATHEEELEEDLEMERTHRRSMSDGSMGSGKDLLLGSSLRS